MPSARHLDRYSRRAFEAVVSLGPGGLERRAPDGTPLDVLPLEAVRQVRLTVEMAGRDSQVKCRVAAADGREIAFGSKRWVAPATYDANAQTFQALLGELHAALWHRRDEIRFLEGQSLATMSVMFGLAALVGVGCLALFVAIFLVAENRYGLALLPGILIGGWLMRVFWPRAPVQYDPRTYMPEDAGAA